jgi:hypothetical protein
VRNERGGMVMGVPFTAGAMYYLDGAGGVWHGHGSAFRIYLSTFLGDTLSEIVLDGTPAPVTDTELEAWEEGPGVRQFREMGGKLDRERIPKVKPYFDGLFVDSDGYVWLSLPAGPREAVFAVLDPDGRYLGRLQVDGAPRVTYLQPVVRNDRLYWVGSDELEVQHVYVYRIEKGAAGAPR